MNDETAAHRVVLTMRSDFEPFVARAQALQPLFEAGKLVLPPLSAGELREAIERPAEQVGLKFEAGLVEALLQDILGEPAALPLLQFTLLRLWEERERNRVTLAAYKKVGGGRLALARSADALYASLIPEEQVTARRVLLRMVRPGEGLEVTSNRVLRSDLDRGGEDPGRVARVLARLTAARLVRETPGDSPDDFQVEVAHEALVRNWPTLVEWLEEDRLSLRRRRRLTAAAEEWQRLDRGESALLRGVALAEAADYDDLNELEQAFVAAGEASEQAEQRRKQRNQRRIRSLAVVASIAAVIATIAGVVAGVFAFQAIAVQGEIEQLQRDTLSRRLAAESQATRNTRPNLAALQAITALRTSPTYEAEDAVRTLFDHPLQTTFRVLSHNSPVNGAVWNHDKTRILSWGGDAQIWDAEGNLIAAMLHDEPVVDATWDHDESHILTRSTKESNTNIGDIKLWDANGTLIATLVDDEFVDGASWNKAGTHILTWGVNYTLICS